MQKQEWIKLWTIVRAKDDMKWGSGKEINWVWYYTFDKAIETAKKQWLTIPTYQDFIDSWFTEDRTEKNKKLADKLWFKIEGYCDSDGILNNEPTYGYRRSASPKDNADARGFTFDESRGELYRINRYIALPVRTILNKKIINTDIWQFSDEELIKELSKRLLFSNK